VHKSATTAVPTVYPRGRTAMGRDGPTRPFHLGKDLGRTPPNGLDQPTDQKGGGSSPSEHATRLRLTRNNGALDESQQSRPTTSRRVGPLGRWFAFG